MNTASTRARKIQRPGGVATSEPSVPGRLRKRMSAPCNISRGGEGYVGEEQTQMGCDRKNRLHSSPRRIVHEERGDHCQIAGFQKSLAQRPELRHAHAYLLHQPRGKGTQRHQATRTRKSEIIALQEDQRAEEQSHAGRLIEQLESRTRCLRRLVPSPRGHAYSSARLGETCRERQRRQARARSRRQSTEISTSLQAIRDLSPLVSCLLSIR